MVYGYGNACSHFLEIWACFPGRVDVKFDHAEVVFCRFLVGGFWKEAWDSWVCFWKVGACWRNFGIRWAEQHIPWWMDGKLMSSWVDWFFSRGAIFQNQCFFFFLETSRENHANLLRIHHEMLFFVEALLIFWDCGMLKKELCFFRIND